jgi:hypothetical protein
LQGTFVLPHTAPPLGVCVGVLGGQLAAALCSTMCFFFFFLKIQFGFFQNLAQIPPQYFWVFKRFFYRKHTEISFFVKASPFMCLNIDTFSHLNYCGIKSKLSEFIHRKFWSKSYGLSEFIRLNFCPNICNLFQLSTEILVKKVLVCLD